LLINGYNLTNYIKHYGAGESTCVTPDTKIEVILENKQIIISISEIEQLLKDGKTIKVKTLDNKYTKITDFVNKGMNETILTELENGKNIKTTLGHRFLTENNWKECRDLIVGEDKLLCANGEYSTVKSKTNVGQHKIVDIEVEGDEECYFGNDIMNHNTGKTYFSVQLIANYLNDNPDGFVILFDSENAINKSRMEGRGVDLSRIRYMPVATLFEFNTQLINILDELNDNHKVGEVKCMIVLDSLGNLPSSKEIADVKKGEQKVDLSRTKEIKAIFRQCTIKLAKHLIPMIVTNHTYTNIMSVGQQVMGGGSGIKFATDYVLQLTKAKNKAADGEVIGNIITSTTVKNRDAKENTKTKHLLSYKHGLHPYYGLVDYAVDCPTIDWEKKGNKVVVDGGDKSYFPKHIYKNSTQFFTKEILDKLNVYMKQFFCYGSDIEEEEIFDGAKDKTVKIAVKDTVKDSKKDKKTK